MSETPSSVDEKLILLEGLEAFSKHALQIIQETTRHCYILSHHLDVALYNTAEIIDAVSLLARKDRNTQIFILVKETRPLVEKNHGLLTLARRLPSKIRIRKLLVEPENDERAYLVSDRDRVLYKHDDEEYSGFANYAGGPEALQLLEEFTYLWQRQSTEDKNLQAFTL